MSYPFGQQNKSQDPEERMMHELHLRPETL